MDFPFSFKEKCILFKPKNYMFLKEPNLVLTDCGVPVWILNWGNWEFGIFVLYRIHNVK